jgi:hypothetical protein
VATKPLSGAAAILTRCLRKYGLAVRLAACFLAEFVATVFVGFAPEADFI